MQMRFEFWQRWLLLASLAFALFGLLVALFPFGFPFALRNEAVAETFFQGRWTAQTTAYHAFSAGPLGGTIAGFYVLQAFIAATAFRRRERWAWQATLWGMLVWFVIDSAVSVWHGAVFNVYLVNLVPLVVFGLPLAMTFRLFFSRDEAPV